MSVKDWENPPQGSRSRRCLELLKKGKANRYAYLYDMKASSRACRQWLCHLKFRDEQSDQEYHNSVEEFLKQEKEQRNHIKEQKEKQAKLINHTPSTYLCRQEFEEGVRFYMGHPNFDATIHKPSDLVYERVGREMRVGLPIVKHHVPQVLPGFMPLATRNPLRRTSASLGPEMIYSSFFIPTDCSLESVVVTATTRGITISCKRVDPLSKKGSVSPPPKKPKRLRDMGPGAKLPANPVTVHRGGAPHENVQDIVAIARAQAMNRTPAILPGNLNPAMTRQNLAPAALTPANLNPNGKWPNHIFDRAVLGAASLSLAPAGAAQHPGAAHVGPHVPPSAALSAAQLAATHPHAHHAHHPSLARAGQPMPKKRKLDHGVPPQVLPQQPGPE